MIFIIKFNRTRFIISYTSPFSACNAPFVYNREQNNNTPILYHSLTHTTMYRKCSTSINSLFLHTHTQAVWKLQCVVSIDFNTFYVTHIHTYTIFISFTITPNSVQLEYSTSIYINSSCAEHSTNSLFHYFSSFFFLCVEHCRRAYKGNVHPVAFDFSAHLLVYMRYPRKEYVG